MTFRPDVLWLLNATYFEQRNNVPSRSKRQLFQKNIVFAIVSLKLS